MVTDEYRSITANNAVQVKGVAVSRNIGNHGTKRARRALSVISQNLVGSKPYPSIVNKRPNSQDGSFFRKFKEPSVQQSSELEGVKITNVESDGPIDMPVPMSLEKSEIVPNQSNEMKEVEMEDIFEDSILDIDGCDSKNPLSVTEYVDDLYTYYRKMEVCSCVSPDYMSQQYDITEKMRAILIDWLVEVHYKFELRDETLFLTVNVIDRFLARHTVERKQLQLVGLIAMLLACKYEEVSVPIVEDFIFISDNAYTRQDLLEMERVVLNTLQFNMSLPTPYVFLRRFLKAAESEKKLEFLCYYLIELSLVEYEMIKYPPSLLAAAAVFTAQCSLYGSKQWSKTCEFYSNYSEEQLLECSRLMIAFHQKAGTGKLTGVYRKYSTSKFGQAAKFNPAVFLLSSV